MAKMARLNISIPEPLKFKMDKHTDVNWSKTACESFEYKINVIESSIEALDMKGAVARLKASKNIFDDSLKKDGYEQGLLWSMQYADYEELKRIEDAFEDMKVPSTLAELSDLITDKNYDMEALFECGIESQEFIDGFIEAALEVKQKADE